MTMKLKEFIIPPVNPAQIKAVADQLFNLAQNAKKLPPEDSARQFVEKLILTLAQKAQGSLSEAVAPGTALNISHQTMQAILSTPQHWVELGEIQKIIASAGGLTNQHIQDRLEALTRKVSTEPEVKKAVKGYTSTVRLNTQGEIVKMDSDLEAYADAIREHLDMPKKWVRNLIGMFGMNIERKDKLAFLQLCKEHKALDITRMVKDRTGNIDNYIVKSPPSIKQVYDSIKGTLLDITLSKGQRDATGPFEAMLCIMGGATKPDKGDIRLGNKNYEVKSSSITASTKAGTSQLNFGPSGGWLDAHKVKAGDVKRHFETLMYEQGIKSKIDPTADFRPGQNPSDGPRSKLTQSLNKIPARSKAEQYKKQLAVIIGVHRFMFPNASGVTSKGYNFNVLCKKILDALLSNDQSKLIERAQGAMGMIEYLVGSYKSDFILWNSSTQEFKFLIGIDEIVNAAFNDPDIHFESSATMKGDKASPSIYYGPKGSKSGANDPRWTDYVTKKKQELTKINTSVPPATREKRGLPTSRARR